MQEIPRGRRAGRSCFWLSRKRLMAGRKRIVEIRISVRNLVEFILRSGDIDNRRVTTADNSMLEGGRIHRMIQRRMGPDYHAVNSSPL